MKKSTQILLMTLIVAIIILIIVFFIIPPKQTTETPVVNDLATSCQSAGGNWIEQYQECEMINNDWCKENNGTFNECASACRHDLEAEICTLQCVFVCEFNQ